MSSMARLLRLLGEIEFLEVRSGPQPKIYVVDYIMASKDEADLKLIEVEQQASGDDIIVIIQSSVESARREAELHEQFPELFGGD